MVSKISSKSLWIGLVSGIMILAIFSAGGAKAQPEVEWPVIDFQEIATGLDYPVHLTAAGDGSRRLFIVEQPGRILIYNNGLVSPPFLDIRDRVRSPRSGGGTEEGLLSVAFPPGFGSTKDHFYVYYTNLAGDNQVSRFSLSTIPEQANPESEELILYLDHPTYSNHNGGQLAFGADGYLYVGTGDGGGGGDPSDNAQNPASLLGKILRIDVEPDTPPVITPLHQIFLPLLSQGSHTSPKAYRIPPTNPFVGLSGYRPEIWALGLRNPWRFSFDTTTGDLFIGDVGQNEWEEINYQPAESPGGENYGWDVMEGKQCYLDLPCDPGEFVLPLFDYPHTSDNCSVTAGHLYRGLEYPGLQGIYFFADFCSGRIWGIQKSAADWLVHEFTSGAFVYGISSFGLDESGELYLVYRRADIGSIYRVQEVTPQVAP
jgi:glucose/arabinose dehydrogenase